MKLPKINFSPQKDMAKMFAFNEWTSIEKKLKNIAKNIRNNSAGEKDISNINSILSKYFKRDNNPESDAMKESLHQFSNKIRSKECTEIDADWLDHECLSFWYHVVNKDIERINKGKFKLS